MEHAPGVDRDKWMTTNQRREARRQRKAKASAEMEAEAAADEPQ